MERGSKVAQQADYVIIGGGSAGCVLAGRLSEDPNHSVCLLEAGGGGDGLIVNVPAAAVVMLSKPLNNWKLETVPQSGLTGRRGFQPRGKCLGGSSAINAMIYIRGHRWDYDHWAAQGNEGWSYDDVLPYFCLSEKNERFHDQYHGNNGPMPVSDIRTDSPFHDYFLNAARECDIPILEDFNGAEQEGAGVFQVTQANGERYSTARAYLFPHLIQRSNLRVETKALVQRIIFHNKRAVAVEYKQGNELHRISANKEIILSAGAFQSPQLLMLSGIGDQQELTQHGIPVVHHLPGVGKNLQDHPDFIFGYTTPSFDTFGFSPGGIVRAIKAIKQFRQQRRGLWTSNFAEAGAFLKTHPNLEAPDIQLHMVTALVDDHGRQLHFNQGYSCHVCVLRPESRGTVTLASGNPNDTPLIDPAFLEDERDLDVLVEGYKITERIMKAPAMARWIAKDMFTAEIKTDDDIRRIIRQRADTVYHPVGTCKMGVDDMAVVDPQLCVKGVSGLRVVDASIMPTLIGGNTNAPVIMIAEKAVDMIVGRSRVASQEEQPSLAELAQ